MTPASDAGRESGSPRRRIERLSASDQRSVFVGQVVLDAAAAVKELLENSLDAGATRVEVRLRGPGGVHSISVSDNGCGIPASDLEQLCSPHATSKLRTFEQLSELHTLGFRGEALSAIAALAGRILLVTRSAADEPDTADDRPAGIAAEYDANGELIRKEPAPRAVGTSVTVEDLFARLPVRRQDAERNSKRDIARAVAVTQSLALVSVAVKVLMVVDGRTVFHTPGVLVGGASDAIGSGASAAPPSTATALPSLRHLYDNIAAVFGDKMASGMLPISAHGTLEDGGAGGAAAKAEDTDRSATHTHRAIESLRAPRDAPPQEAPADAVGTRAHDGSADKAALTEDERRWTLAGWMSRTERCAGRSATDRQFVYLNRRPVDFPRLSKALNEIYRKFTLRTYPSFVLCLQCHPRCFDINLQPDKRLVTFLFESDLLSAIRHEVETRWQQEQESVVIGSSSSAQQPILGRLPAAAAAAAAAASADGASISAGSPQEPDTPAATSAPRMSGIGGPHGCSEVHAEVSGELPVRSSPSHHSPSSASASASAAQDMKALSAARAPPLPAYSGGSRRRAASLAEFVARKRQRSVGAAAADAHAGAPPPPAPPRFTASLAPVNTPKSDCQSDLSPNTGGASPSPSPTPSDAAEEWPAAEAASVDAAPGELRAAFDRPRSSPPDASVSSASSSKISFEMDVVLAAVKRGEDDDDDDDDSDDGDGRTVGGFHDAPTFAPGGVGDDAEGGGAEVDRAEVERRAEDELRRRFHKRSFRQLRVVGQFNLGFIVCQLNGADLFIVDQHAADEKYNFETLQSSTEISTQPLLQPLTLQMSAEDELHVLECVDAFRAGGFTLRYDPTRPPTQRFSLRSVPFSKNTVYTSHDVLSMLDDVRSIVATGCAPPPVLRPRRMRDMFASRACRMSVMIGDDLSYRRMREVVHRLSELDSPWNCPHGRPTVRHLWNFRRARPRKEEGKQT